MAEVRKRGKDFWAEFEFYLSDLVVGLVSAYTHTHIYTHDLSHHLLCTRPLSPSLVCMHD